MPGNSSHELAATIKQPEAGTKEDCGEAEFKQHAKEISEPHEQIIDCKIDNILHAAKISRTGEVHITRANAMISKTNAEALKLRREANSDKRDGINKCLEQLETSQLTRSYVVKETETLLMVGSKAN